MVVKEKVGSFGGSRVTNILARGRFVREDVGV